MCSQFLIANLNEFDHSVILHSLTRARTHPHIMEVDRQTAPPSFTQQKLHLICTLKRSAVLSLYPPPRPLAVWYYCMSCVTYFIKKRPFLQLSACDNTKFSRHFTTIWFYTCKTLSTHYISLTTIPCKLIVSWMMVLHSMRSFQSEGHHSSFCLLDMMPKKKKGTFSLTQDIISISAVWRSHKKKVSAERET